ncbi:hypothetical protein [Streptomyces sp. AM6-12]|uniref:hypothetical protein n=1 Tax=Streptomyces sp. AM6-12 TaxID=3345149 RepID=UPI00378C7593
MDAERAKRVVAALRDRGIMAHLVEAGVYEFGIRVVLDEGIEALWDTDGVSGLDAEVLSDGVLIGFVPHVPGSDNFTEQQIVDSIAATRYPTEGLRPPPADVPPPPPAEGFRPPGDVPPPPPAEGFRPPGDVAPPPPPARSRPEEPAPAAPPVSRYQRWARWLRHGGH